MKKMLLVLVAISVILGLLVSVLGEERENFFEAREIEVSEVDIIVINDSWSCTNTTFRQDGNITISNSTFNIINTRLEILQATNKTHYISFSDGSTFNMENSTLTTGTWKFNAWLKLNITINNTKVFIKNSTIAFPGTIWFKDSKIEVQNSKFTSLDPTAIPAGLDVDDNNDDCPLLIFENCAINITNSRVEDYYECSLEEQAFVSLPSNHTFLPGNSTTFGFVPTPNLNQITPYLSAVVLEIAYSGEEWYNGTEYVKWSRNGKYSNTTIKPGNYTKTEIYDLFSEGVCRIEDLYNLRILFTNNDSEYDNKSNMTFNSVKLIFSYENDITLINSVFYAIDTYLDLDFRICDIDPRIDVTTAPEPKDYFIDASLTHNVLRARNNSRAFLYNVTIDTTETSGVPASGNPSFIADNTSTILFYRWLRLETTDYPGMGVDNVSIITSNATGIVEMPPEIVLQYLSRNESNYNLSIGGVALIPLLTDRMLPEQWPNSLFVGNYNITASYQNYTILNSIGFKYFPHIEVQDNTEVVNIKFEALIPDLTVSSLIVSKLTPTEGEEVGINVKVENVGTTPAYNVDLKFFDNDNLFYEKELLFVGINAAIELSTNWTAHSTTPSEAHNISVIVNPLDATDVILETNYENNEAYGLVTVYSRPDLSVENILFSSSFAVEGDEITVSASIINTGETDANVVIEFYKDGMRFNSSNIFVAANDSIPVNTSFTTAGEGGNVLITVKITNSTPEESNVLNNEKSASIFVYAKHSMVLESEKVLPPSFTWKGYIIVKDEGSLILSNATLTMKENTEKRCEIIVLNNGKLIVQNSIITSNANLKLYLYGNSVLTVINSTMILDVVGSGESEISIQNGIINGTVDVGCKMFSAAEFNLTGDLKLNAITVNIENSFVNATNISISASKLWANNTNLTSPLTFSMGNAYLINVTVPEIKPINATIHRYWWMNVDVTDSAGSALSNATINVYSTQTEPFELVASSSTDENGTAVIALPTDTNYLVNATYGNWSREIYEYIENNTIITMVIPNVIIEPTSIIITIDEILEVKAGETTNISGTIKYNLKNIPVENVTVTLTLNGENYPVDVSPDGSYSKGITVPNKAGTYTVKITVVDHAYNLSTAEETAQLTITSPPPAPVNIIPVVATVVIIIVVIIICVIKRKLLKAYLIVLKAKVKKEEFTECTECSKKIPSTLKKCPYCDTEFGEEKEAAEEERAKCSECGALIPVSAKKCPKCGAAFEE